MTNAESVTYEVHLHTFTPESPLFSGVAELFRGIWPSRFFSTSDAASRIRQHARYPGFCGFAAVVNSTVVGFVYGYTNLPGQWWYDQITRELERRNLSLQLHGSFAFTELGVAQPWRGRGIGRRLHDTVLAHLPHPYAVLSTQCENQPALALYRHCGWETLIERMRFDSGPPDFTILGKSLR